LRKRDPSPPWQGPFLLAFTGIRGVVSLAAALAIPYTLANGAPFPHRDLILFITFGVIIVTLVGQGAMLPAVVRALGLTRIGLAERRDEQRAEIGARQKALDVALKRLDKFAAEQKLADDVLEHLRTRHLHRLQQLPGDMEDGLEHKRQTAELKKALIDAERDFIYEQLRAGEITDDARRRIEYELDLEEASLANRRRTDGGWL
jgi:CPA1 family monovalent cation:H+ antiporter